MSQRYFIQATSRAAQGFCAAAGGASAKMPPPPLNGYKSISYKRFAQQSDGTLQSRKDCGVPFCMPLYGLQNLDGGKTVLCKRYKPQAGAEKGLCNDYEPLTGHKTGFQNRYKLSTGPKSDFVIITKPRRGQK